MRTRATQAWPTKPLRYLTSRRPHDNWWSQLSEASEASFLPMDAIGEQGQLDLSETRPVDQVQSGYSRFSDGDVVIAKITPCFENGKGAVIQGTLDGVGFGTTELHVLTPGAQIDGKYLYYVTVDREFRQLGAARMTGAAGQQRVPDEFVRNYKIDLPPLTQQHAITDYLDRETALLDALIAAKKQILELLAEKRQAIIARAVTCGLDSCATLRDSGVSWLGEIPENWRTLRAARLFRERDEHGEPDLPLLEVSINAGVVVREFSQERIETTAADFNTYKVARQDDVVFNKMRMWQGAAGVAPQDGLVSPDYVVAAPIGALSPAYAALLFRVDSLSAECARRSHGIVWDRLRLYWRGFRDIELPVPPASTQQEIADHVVEATAKLDALALATERTVSLIKERRAALVAAAMAGQLTLGVSHESDSA